MRAFLIILGVLVIVGIIAFVIYRMRTGAGGSKPSGPTPADCSGRGATKTGATKVVNGITIYETVAYNFIPSETLAKTFLAYYQGEEHYEIRDFVYANTTDGFVCTKSKPYKDSQGINHVNVNCNKTSACKPITGWTNEQGQWVNPATGLPVQAGEGKD